MSLKQVQNLSLLLFIAGNSFSQQLPFVYYTPKEGLINSRVRGIKQDSRGRMYFVTYGGLSVYDGARFTNYGQLEGLANELVNDIVEITPDSFLIASNGPELNTLVRGKIGKYKTSDGYCPVINRLLKSSDGHWYACADEGLYKLDNKKFSRLPVFDSQGLNIGQNLDKIIEWKNYFLIIPWNENQKEKLILYDRVNQRVADAFTMSLVTSIAMIPNGQIWISTSEGIRLIDSAGLLKGKLTTSIPADNYEKKLNTKIARLGSDKFGNIFLYNEDHIYKISPQQEVLVISPDQGLKMNKLADVITDREGITWIASDGYGIAKMTGSNIQLLNNFSTGKTSNISAIHHQVDTTWLFDGASNKIIRIHKNNQKIFQLDRNEPTNSSPRISNMYVVGKSLFMSDTKDFFRILNKDDESSYRNPEKIVSYEHPFAIGNGVVDRNGAIIQSVTKDTSFYLTVIYENKVVMDYEVSYSVDQLSLDDAGRLWIVTRDNHLVSFTLHPEQPSHYLRLLKDFSSELPFKGARSLTIDKNGNAWVGTRYNGLYFLKITNMQLDSSKQFTTRQGLTDNFIYRLYCDENNTIWVGTQTGLDKIFIKNGKYIIENITKSINIYQTISKITSGDKNITWALTSAGTIIKVSSNTSIGQTSAPPLLLTSLMVNDLPCSDTIRTFAHDENNFSIRVASPSFIDERSILYSYQLKGSGKNNWSEPSNNSTFNFINLAPGTYELKLKADFPASRYAPQLLTYSFIVSSPFWQTWWFRFAVIGIVIVMMYFVVREYYRRIFERKQVQFEKKQALEEERTRIASDMHDDLGAGLSKIRFLSETVQRTSSDEANQPNLQNIAASSVELVDKFNEIIWAMNEKNNSLEDLLYYMRNYTAKYCAENKLEYKILMPEFIPSIIISGEMRRHIFLTVKECLHNIVKHAEAKNVELQVKLDAFMTICIQDDGKGFTITEMMHEGNGLRNMKQRIKNVNGKLVFENGVGTSVKIVVPIPVM